MPGLSAGQHTSRGILRSEYLRFRALRHADPVEALLAAIPQAARWRLGSLPEYLNQEELARLMSAFEQADSQRQRDHAIVRCLVDLGLRSFEVAALTRHARRQRAAPCLCATVRHSMLPLTRV